MKVIDKGAYFRNIEYAPHPQQDLYHRSKARFRIPCCGRRFGKSTMAARDLEPQLFVPKQRFWIVGPTYDLGEKEFRVLWDDLIISKGLGRDRRVKKAYNRRSGEMFIEFPWQTRVEVRSADHPENLVGEALHGVIMSEAAKQKRETWERYIRAALADFRGWATFPTTPEGHNWLYEVWRLGQNPEMPDYESWRFPSWSNTHVYPGGRDDDEIKLIEATSAPEWFLQEIAADFASFVGKIYPEFDETTHVTKCEFNPAWKNYITFDWGYVNPLAAVEFQITPWDEVRVWREHYKSYWRLEQHLDYMKNREQPEGYHVDLCFGDAADPEAVNYVNQHFAPCIADPDAKTNWRAGVDTVKGFLRLRQTGVLDEYGTPMMAPGLFVDYSCNNTVREFNTYKAPDTTRVVMAKERSDTKQDDHAMDALRYGLVHLFQLGAQSHLSQVATADELVGSPSMAGRGYFTTTQGF